MAKIGFIGMGNMGYAMLKGALAAFSPSDIIFSSPDREKCERISSETGVRFAEVAAVLRPRVVQDGSDVYRGHEKCGRELGSQIR